MAKTVLVVAFHFPPVATSSGLQRALKTVKYLGDYGWKSVVLSPSLRAYSQTADGQSSEVPDDVDVFRTFCLDSSRHLAIRGRHLGVTAIPDPWISWWPSALMKGMRIIRQFQPRVIWSTFPVTTANLIAHSLAKTNKLPWVLDLRDPMTLPGYPDGPLKFRVTRWIERENMKRANRVVFASDGTRSIYEKRYRNLSPKTLTIPNGYDEINFPNIATRTLNSDSPQIHIVHSGFVQPVGRNPTAFFNAIRKLKQDGTIDNKKLKITLRAAGFQKHYRSELDALAISDIVQLAPYLPYNEAIKEMMAADGLMVMQGTLFNHSVPAKFYEYLYARRPIFGLVDKAGSTAKLMCQLGFSSFAQYDDVNNVVANFRHYLDTLRNGTFYLPDKSAISRFSRRQQVRLLAEVLDDVSAKTME